MATATRGLPRRQRIGGSSSSASSRVLGVN
jgi:hypothetical protein